MKKLQIALFILISIKSLAQGEIKINVNGKSIEEIIPKACRILDTISGDLNQDGIIDLVFAIQYINEENYEINNGLGIDTIDLNPRILGIYFGNPEGSFDQKMISEDFIILQDSPTMDEPFEGFSMNKKGVLDINFKFWYSAGSWSMSNHSYRFRYQNDQFELIGYESNEAHRASGETTDYSINFLTKKMKVTKGNFSNDKPESVKWKKFKLNSLLTIKSLGKPFEFEFEGIYL